MAVNRPRGRQKNVTGQGKSVKRRGSGLGTGPVGSSGGYQGRPGRKVGSGGLGGGSNGNIGNSGPRTTRSGGGLSKIIMILVILLFAGGGGIGSLFSGGLGGSDSGNMGSSGGNNYGQHRPFVRCFRICAISSPSETWHNIIAPACTCLHRKCGNKSRPGGSDRIRRVPAREGCISRIRHHPVDRLEQHPRALSVHNRL